MSLKTRADLDFPGLETDSNGNSCVWENHYRCDNCDDDSPITDEIDWISVHSCQCNDRCPTCGTEIEPYDSIWIGPDDPELRALWERLPEA